MVSDNGEIFKFIWDVFCYSHPEKCDPANAKKEEKVILIGKSKNNFSEFILFSFETNKFLYILDSKFEDLTVKLK